jgi:hypothetical protein
MSISWDEVIRILKSRGYRYYNASTGPIEIDWWFGPHGGKNGYWIFVSKDTITRDVKYGYTGGDDEYRFS